MPGFDTFPATDRALNVIAHAVLAADTASLTFANIPQTFRHLRLMADFKSTYQSTVDDARLRINGDSSASYYRQRCIVIGSGTSITPDPATTPNPIMGRVIAASLNANSTSPIVVDILNYATAKWKNYIGLSSVLDNNMNTSQLEIAVAQRVVAEAITSLTIDCTGGSMKAGGIISLYGLA